MSVIRFQRSFRQIAGQLLPVSLALLLTRLVFTAGELAAVSVCKTSDTPLPSSRQTYKRIRHDVWFPSIRNLRVHALQKIRTARPNGRQNNRRNSQSNSVCTLISSPILPVVVPNNSDGLNPCRNPSFHSFRNRSCPVRAGPFYLS